MKKKFVNLYMDWAERVADLSHARRLHVGAVIVKDDTVISYGYNGMPAGWDNNCEHTVLNPDGTNELKTNLEVLHAESNAIAKLAKNHNSGLDASIFVTHSPCLECAKLIYQAGIKNVYYRTHYRSNDGLDFLKKCQIEVLQVE
jgi:dCMP deaminase